MILRDLPICDYGDVERDLNWERYFSAVTEQASRALDHPFALFLGGDHSVSIPLLRAFSEKSDKPFGVLHIDAHTDLINECEGHRWSHGGRAGSTITLSPPPRYFNGGNKDV